ncbi:MAG: hypothetical protein RL699_1813 [Bacteroidota bacterium]|jgi:AraC-like DNA-binding protein
MVLIVSITVVLLSLLLIYNNFSKNKNSLYICGSLMCMSMVAILHHFTIVEPDVFWIAIISGHSLPFAFLIGPFLYFYTRNALAGKIIHHPSDGLHYIPFLIVLASIFPYYFTDFGTKLKLAQLLIDNPNNMITKLNFSWLYPSYWNILIRPLFLLVYAVLSLYLLFYKIKLKKLQFSTIKNDSRLKWLLVINSIFFLIGLLYSILTANFFLRFIQNREEINNSPFSYLVYVLLCSLPVIMVIFPEILYDVKKNKKTSKPELAVEADNHEDFVKTTESILEFLRKEENLVNPNLSSAAICKALNLTKEEVKYCFEVVLKSKLANVKKQLRVELAKDGKLMDHSMEGIWMKAGFTSKTSFFVTFKEVTGLTPLEYVKFIVEESKAK